MRSAHISVPTTDAALFRVIVESRIPKAAIAAIGQEVEREAGAASRPSPCPKLTVVPESEVSGSKPHAKLAASEADRAHREQDRRPCR